MIQLHVGSGQKVFTVHKGVLVQIPFFRKCLEGNDFLEGTTNVIELPEEDTIAVEQILHYAYSASTKRLEVGGSDDAGRHRVAETLMKAYVLADKWCIEDSANNFVDRLQLHYRKWRVTHHHIKWLRKNGPVDSLMRLMMLEEVAWHIRGQGWDHFLKARRDGGASFLKWCAEGGVDIVDLLKSCANEHGLSPPSFGDSSCTWHKHDSTPKCRHGT